MNQLMSQSFVIEGASYTWCRGSRRQAPGWQEAGPGMAGGRPRDGRRQAPGWQEAGPGCSGEGIDLVGKVYYLTICIIIVRYNADDDLGGEQVGSSLSAY